MTIEYMNFNYGTMILIITAAVQTDCTIVIKYPPSYRYSMHYWLSNKYNLLVKNTWSICK